MATISGNQIVQGPATQNNKIIDYGEESLSFSNNSLLISHNTITNTAPNSIAVYDPRCVTVQLLDNAFQGVATLVDPSSCVRPINRSLPRNQR